MIEFYPTIKLAHALLALISGLGFAWRGYVRLVLNRKLRHRLLRIAPHVLDTLLLLTGASLWSIMRFSPLAPAWFGLKLALVVVYIGLGMLAFRARAQARAMLLYLAALSCFFTIAWLALFKPL